LLHLVFGLPDLLGLLFLLKLSLRLFVGLSHVDKKVGRKVGFYDLVFTGAGPGLVNTPFELLEQQRLSH
jgi:hypothetical protein